MSEEEPTTLTFDLDKVTLGDIVDIEEVCGRSWDDIVEMDSPPTKVLLAMVWVAKRRDNPKFTLDDARQTPIAEIQAMTVGSDPTVAAD